MYGYRGGRFVVAYGRCGTTIHDGSVFSSRGGSLQAMCGVYLGAGALPRQRGSLRLSKKVEVSCMMYRNVDIMRVWLLLDR